MGIFCMRLIVTFTSIDHQKKSNTMQFEIPSTTFKFDATNGTIEIADATQKLTINSGEWHQWAVLNDGTNKYFEDIDVTNTTGGGTRGPGSLRNNEKLNVTLTPVGNDVILIGNGDLRDGGQSKVHFEIDITNLGTDPEHQVIVFIEKKYLTVTMPAV